MYQLNVTPYDFEGLLEKFEEMTEHEILTEYVYLCKAYNLLMNCPDEDFVNPLFDNISSAMDYLGHYIAKGYCHNLGYEI